MFDRVLHTPLSITYFPNKVQKQPFPDVFQKKKETPKVTTTQACNFRESIPPEAQPGSTQRSKMESLVIIVSGF